MIDWCAIWECVKDCGTEILKIIGTSTMIVGAAAWFFRKVIGKRIDLWYDKKNKDYQAELDEKARVQQLLLDQQLSDYKTALDDKSRSIQNRLDTQLEIARVEYGTLYHKRLEVIIELQRWLLIFSRHAELLELMSVNNPDKTKAFKLKYSEAEIIELRDFNPNNNEFRSFVEKNRIYLSKDLAKIIQGLPNLFVFCFVNMNLDSLLDKTKRCEELKGREEEFEIGLKCFSEHYGEMKSEGYSIQNIIDALENEFRHLIGADIKRN